MAIMPGAIWRPLANASKIRMSAYDITCVHTMVGSLLGTDSYFRGGSGVNSHFGTGGDGTIYQWVDTAFRSGANLNGNDRVVSIENADLGPEFAPWDINNGAAVPAFPPAQIEANAQIVAWVHKTHGTPLDGITDSKRGRRGTGWHWLGVPLRKGDTVSQTGGELWSKSAGKVCPGNRRTAQIPQIIARAKQIASGAVTPPAAPVIDLRGPEMRIIRDKENGQIFTATDTEVAYEGDPAVYAALTTVWGEAKDVTRRQIDLLAYDANERRANLRREIADEVAARLAAPADPS